MREQDENRDDSSSRFDRDSMDRVPMPRLNPWLAIILLFTALTGYILLWETVLGG